MTPTTPTTTPDRLPFEWTGGDTSTDFVNTVSWGLEGLSQERLRSYDDLLDWALEGGLLAQPEALRSTAARDTTRGAAVLAVALELRACLHALFAACAAGEPPPAEALATLDRWAADAADHLRLAAEGERLVWRWTDETELAAPLRRVARSAALLLTSDDAGLVKLCGNSDCGWVFVDRSRRGNRRWCEMAECGSRAKAKRYYRRRRAAEEAERRAG
jgi:predicted RNA-binding Zn ribbon-like protein